MPLVKSETIIEAPFEKLWELAQAVEKNSRGLQQKLWEGISDAEMKGLIVLLDRCLKNLDGFDDSAADY